MKYEFEIPVYDKHEGLDIFAEKNSKMKIICNNNYVEVLANREALISLGKQFLYLAENDLPNGSHVHYDGFFIKLDENSKELIISKKD